MTFGATSSSCSLGRAQSPSRRARACGFGRPTLDDVAHVNFVSLVSHRADHPIEQLPSLADERKSLLVLVGARPFPNEAKLRRRIASRENGLVFPREAGTSATSTSSDNSPAEPSACPRSNSASAVVCLVRGAGGQEARCAVLRADSCAVPCAKPRAGSAPGARATPRLAARAWGPARGTPPAYGRQRASEALPSRDPGRSGLDLPLRVRPELFRQTRELFGGRSLNVPPVPPGSARPREPPCIRYPLR